MISLSWGGKDSVKAALDNLIDAYPHVAAQALREEAEIEMTEAKQRTPVETGNLRASGLVETDESDELVVHLKFGGPAAPYAVYVHENLDAHHPVGQAKFLESVVRESAPYMAQRIASRISEIVGE